MGFTNVYEFITFDINVAQCMVKMKKLVYLEYTLVLDLEGRDYHLAAS